MLKILAILLVQNTFKRIKILIIILEYNYFISICYANNAIIKL